MDDVLIWKMELFMDCRSLGKALDESWDDFDAFIRACNKWGKMMADIRMYHWYDEFLRYCDVCDLKCKLEVVE